MRRSVQASVAQLAAPAAEKSAATISSFSAFKRRRPLSFLPRGRTNRGRRRSIVCATSARRVRLAFGPPSASAWSADRWRSANRAVRAMPSARFQARRIRIQRKTGCGFRRPHGTIAELRRIARGRIGATSSPSSRSIGPRLRAPRRPAASRRRASICAGSNRKTEPAPENPARSERSATDRARRTRRLPDSDSKVRIEEPVLRADADMLIGPSLSRIELLLGSMVCANSTHSMLR